MIVSFKHKFIFVKTHKTAGTSIELALARICGNEDIITPLPEKDEKIRQKLDIRPPQNLYIPFKYYNEKDIFNSVKSLQLRKYWEHMTAQHIKRYIDRDIWNSYYKFTIERNPYDKMVSRYYWKGKDTGLGINEFCQKYSHLYSDFDKYSINNCIVMDRVFKYECLKEMEKELNELFNLKSKLDFSSIKAKSGYRPKKHYSEFLNNESVSKIKKSFAREIEYFNFEY